MGGVEWDITVLATPTEKDVLEVLQVRVEAQAVNVGLLQVRVVLEAQLEERRRLFPLLHQPHPWENGRVAFRTWTWGYN